MEELEKKSTVELIADLTIFEQQKKIRKELIRRFPMIEDNEEFKSN